MMPQFSAPWSLKLKLTTGAFVALLLGPPLGIELFGGSGEDLRFTLGIPILIVVGCAAFTVRGYTIEGDTLYVHRLGWRTAIDLRALRDVEIHPGATAGSVRTFGNGGLFGFIGRFRNGMLGAYRAYVTDASREVVLELEDDTLVVSPGEPASFVETIEQGRVKPA